MMGNVGILTAFFSGLVSFFAPCVVPLLPAYVGYVSGASLSELSIHKTRHVRKQIWVTSLFFVLGFSVIFVMMGVAAASFGAVFRRQAWLIQTGGGLLVMLLALQFMGIIKPLVFSSKQFKLPGWTKHFRLIRSFMVGMIFASVWTPCIGAVLGIILTLAATSQTVWQGGILLAIYSLGISVPFLLLSVLLSTNSYLRKWVAQQASGLVKVVGAGLFVIGFLLFNNSLHWFWPWLTYDHLNGFLFDLAFRFGTLFR